MPHLPTLAQALKGAGKQSTPSLSSGDLPSLSEVLAQSHTAHAGKPEHHGGGGLLHTLGHIAGQTVSDLYNTAVHSPEGLYQTGKAVAELTAGNPDDALKLVKATGKGVVEDFRHPLRHPGNTLLDLGAVLSLGAGTAARAAEVGRVAEAGEGGAALARAALKGPKPEARVIDYGGEKVAAGEYSRSASLRATQKLADRFQQRFPDVRLPVRNLHERVGKELATDRRIEDAIGRHPAHQLGKVKLSAAKQTALRVVAEGVPIPERIAFHRAELPTLSPKLAMATRKQIGLLTRAQKYVHDVQVDGHLVPTLKPENADLIDAFQLAKNVAHKREGLLGEKVRLVRGKDGKVARVAALADDTARGREAAPGLLVSPHAFNPDVVPELFRVPYAATKAKGALFGMAGYKGGIPRTPGTLTHTFTGALLKAGAFRNETSKLVAESYLEAHRFTALIRHRDEFLRLAHDEKQSPFDVPIRTDQLLNRPWPKAIDDLVENGHLSADDLDALENFYNEARGEVFPSEQEIVKTLGPGAHPEVKWIDERLLGGINKPNPLVGFTGGARTALKTFDSINNAERLSILYLKPAYAVPNLLGNLALTLVQQGFAAPLNLAKAARLNAKLGPELASKVDTAMGEGFTAALHSQEGALSKVVNKAANVWQGPVDTPFRRASFLHEAARHGYKTADQIRKLFDTPDVLNRVVREANAELIDYGRLGPFERNVIRRVVFFYPWVKGSTVYAARFAGTHPMQAAALGQLGKQGAAADQSVLGPVPSYAEGIFKVGERGHNPLTLNPSSAGILQTPAQLMQAVRELGSNHPGEAFQLSQNFTPAVAAALALLARQGVNTKQSALQGAKDQLVGGLPIVTLLQGLEHPPAGSHHAKLYPRTRADVVAHFLLGGLAPTPVNQAEARKLKYGEDHPH